MFKPRVRMSQKKNDEGTALLVVLIFVMVMGLWMGSALSLAQVALNNIDANKVDNFGRTGNATVNNSLESSVATVLSSYSAPTSTTYIPGQVLPGTIVTTSQGEDCAPPAANVSIDQAYFLAFMMG